MSDFWQIVGCFISFACGALVVYFITQKRERGKAQNKEEVVGRLTPDEVKLLDEWNTEAAIADVLLSNYLDKLRQLIQKKNDFWHKVEERLDIHDKNLRYDVKTHQIYARAGE